MTCIVGLVDDIKTVWIGADSAGTTQDGQMAVHKDAKVFHNGPYIIAGTTSFRMLQLLHYSLKPPTPETGEDIYGFMVTRFVDAVRECLKAGGFATKQNEQEEGGTFLVGYKGCLFAIDSDYQVRESACGYEAIGCGAQLAQGALCALEDYDLKPSERIYRALRAADRHNAFVCEPYVIMPLHLNGEKS